VRWHGSWPIETQVAKEQGLAPQRSVGFDASKSWRQAQCFSALQQDMHIGVHELRGECSGGESIHRIHSQVLIRQEQAMLKTCGQGLRHGAFRQQRRTHADLLRRIPLGDDRLVLHGKPTEEEQESCP
jgi:hypothetical protein